MKIFSIKCPRCSSKADAIMKRHGMQGTYREALIGFGIEKIICSGCSLSRLVKEGNELKYELWYKSTFKENLLWANNQEHIEILIEWLSGNMEGRKSNSYFETLPKWMITNKDKVVEKLKKMKNR